MVRQAFFPQSSITVLTTTYRSSYLITVVFMTVTAAVLAEICSALPVSGSIYIWAAQSAGPKYARFFGFIVAWWSCTAWMTFTAGNCQVREVLFTVA
jgi:amino acid transporter